MAKKDPLAGLPDHIAEAFRSGGSVLVHGPDGQRTVTDPDDLPEHLQAKRAEKPEGKTKE